jgi:uncharacterized protein
VTGGTGFVGASLVESLLADGHVVTVLGRDAGQIRLKFGSRTRVALWSTPDDPAWCEELASHDVLVNLAGAQAIATRFTPGKKQRIRDSRVKTTRNLVEALERAAKRPVRLVSASAVGFYGPQAPGKDLDESSPVGCGFLAELCHEWETAASSATSLGIGVAIARLGVVIGPGGGAFEAMARTYRLGIGGQIGNGRHDVSYVSLTDAVRALRRCIEDPTIIGPVNVTAPVPVTASEMASSLGRTLRRPNWLRVPGFALRVLYGEGAEALLTGQRAIPKVLQRAGFEWQHPSIDQALQSALVEPHRPTSRDQESRRDDFDR